MLLSKTHRPRNVDAIRAGGILYGDLGTSKAYVIGLAFALAGYASFWLIAAVSFLVILVGINYISICKHYPSGGGVYTSARRRSEVLSMMGAFFLIADYLVTAALSALSAFYYFGASHPMYYAALAIAVIGVINYFGPRHAGSFAFGVVIFAVVTLTLLAAISLPYLEIAWHNIEPLNWKREGIWRDFVGVIVALSGIEAIATTTGVMMLDKGSTKENPQVGKTARKAILWVIGEVAIYTSLFAFVVAAIPHLSVSEGAVNAPGHPDVRDYMLRYMGEVFASDLFGAHVGQIFAWIVSAAVGILLLSAVNTAIGGLISLQYVMSGDGEVPRFFQKVNTYGVPFVPLLLAIVVPIVLVLTVSDVADLASLYAIGFVGAIATNLGATSTDKTIKLTKWERGFMMISFLIMLSIEITLFIDKPKARNYVVTIIAIGLFLRGLTREFKLKELLKKSPGLSSLSIAPPAPGKDHAILCPVTKMHHALTVAIEKATKQNRPLYILFLREQKVITDFDATRTFEEDEEAQTVYDFVMEKAGSENFHFHYSITDSRPDAIVKFARKLNISEVILPLPSRGPIGLLIRGNPVRDVMRLLPSDIKIYVIP